MNSDRKLIANTWLLYMRAAINLSLGLFSTRYILDALGVDNFGIFSVVGSSVTFLTFLNNGLSEATTRFLSFHRNTNAANVSARIFNTSAFVQFSLAIFISITLEVASIYMFGNVLRIPPHRIIAARAVFHCMVGCTFFTVLGAPYDACIVSREKFSFFTLLSIFESVAKFALAISLYFSPFDRLESYGLGVLIIACLGLIGRVVFCNIYFAESRLNYKLVDSKILREITLFCVWILIDLLSGILKFNSMDLILNSFVGAVANAAYAISKQVSGSLLSFSSSVFSASRPQIVSAIGSNDLAGAVKRTYSLAKFSFLLIGAFSFPLYVEMPRILNLWLKAPPPNSISFCRLSLISNIVSLCAIRGFSTLIDGKGNIRNYRLWMAFCNATSLPFGYVALKLGAPIFSVLWGIIFSDIMQVVVTVTFLAKRGISPVRDYAYNIPARIIPISIIQIAALKFLSDRITGLNDIYHVATISVISVVALITQFMFILSVRERQFLFQILGSIWTRMKWSE